LGEKRKQGAFTLEEPPQELGNGEGKVAMGHGSEDLFLEFLCEEDGAFGLAGGAEIPGLAGKSEQMLRVAGRAPKASEASKEAATF